MSPRDDEDALQARRQKLGEALKAAQAKPVRDATSQIRKPDSAGAGMSMAMKAGSEFVAAILVGAAIGWSLDWLLRTKPAFTIVFFLLGVVAGVWNVIRATSPKVGK